MGLSLETVPPIVRGPLVELKRRLATAFGDRLAEVRLYGSWARGQPRVGSDVDVIVTIREMTDADRRRVFDVETGLILEGSRPFSLQVLSADEFDLLVAREVGFALDVLREGIAA